MSVIVQQMVDSAVSGVIFTVNPFGMLTEAMIESYFGQGESLVSGEISPDQYVIDRGDLKIIKQGINMHKKYATYGKLLLFCIRNLTNRNSQRRRRSDQD